MKIFLLPYEEEDQVGNEQETSFGGEGQRTKLVKEHVKGLYRKLSERMGKTLEAFHFDYFELRDGELYYKGKSTPLMIRGRELKLIETIADILGKKRLHNLGFDIPTGKVTARQAVMLNRVEEELPSASDIAKADDIELQEIMENAMKSMEDLIAQFEGQEMLPMHELLGLDKQLRSIRGLLKMEVAKRFSWKKASRKKSASSKNYETILKSMMMAFEKTS